MEAMETDTPKQENQPPETSFKKPMLVGKIGKFPKRLNKLTKPEQEDTVIEDITIQADPPPEPKIPENKPDLKSLRYEEPSWSSVPEASEDYILEVLKNGAIIETINLMMKPYWVFGRLAQCDVCMQHPTISRYHAVLQYRSDDSGDKTGFYIYDLESTHGTFLNKNRVRPRSYTRMHVGHMLKLGCSTRTYILNGPSQDAEEESALSVTELKQKREAELRQREQHKLEEEERRKKQEERGIDWGLGEDADEETDLSENPFAQTNNEELYLDNPKKALRGFFEREGLELEYDCTEQGMGQFLCKVELPVDDEMGRPIYAEVIHKGKKKEAVIQCALEACRILDRHGLLRQATHESKKRKPKNWEENDYYDSDDDTFLDRTGSVEKKREMRMNAKVPQKAETYDSLMEKEKKMVDSIRKLEAELASAHKKLEASNNSSASEAADPLDSFMMELKQSKPSKQTVNKLKSELIRLKQEHGNIIKLVNIAKPASLPPLVADYSSDSNKKNVEKKALPIFGKRKKIKLQLTSQNTEMQVNNSATDGLEEEEEEESEVEEDEDADEESDEPVTVKENKNLKIKDDQMKLNTSSEEGGAEEEGRKKIESTSTKLIKVDDKNDITDKELSAEALERRKRRNQRRIQQKQEKAEMQKQKGYDEDAHKEDYNMWVPPNNQSGDGRTSLNDKFGY